MKKIKYNFNEIQIDEIDIFLRSACFFNINDEQTW